MKCVYQILIRPLQCGFVLTSRHTVCKILSKKWANFSQFKIYVYLESLIYMRTAVTKIELEQIGLHLQIID